MIPETTRLRLHVGRAPVHSIDELMRRPNETATTESFVEVASGFQRRHASSRVSKSMANAHSSAFNGLPIFADVDFLEEKHAAARHV